MAVCISCTTAETNSTTVHLRPTDLFTVGDLNILDYRALSSHNLYSLSQWHTYTHQRYTQRKISQTVTDSESSQEHSSAFWAHLVRIPTALPLVISLGSPPSPAFSEDTRDRTANVNDRTAACFGRHARVQQVKLAIISTALHCTFTGTHAAHTAS